MIYSPCLKEVFSRIGDKFGPSISRNFVWNSECGESPFEGIDEFLGTVDSLSDWIIRVSVYYNKIVFTDVFEKI